MRPEYQPECETPKSPPGDYKLLHLLRLYLLLLLGVKHLNPRQGITTLCDHDQSLDAGYFPSFV